MRNNQRYNAIPNPTPLFSNPRSPVPDDFHALNDLHKELKGDSRKHFLMGIAGSLVIVFFIYWAFESFLFKPVIDQDKCLAQITGQTEPKSSIETVIDVVHEIKTGIDFIRGNNGDNISTLSSAAKSSNTQIRNDRNRNSTQGQPTNICKYLPLNQIVDLAKNRKSTTGAIVFFLLSRLLTGLFLIATLYVLLNLTMSSFDQSVRTSKRYHGANFIKFLFIADKADATSVKEKMAFYDTWIKTIESAFSNESKNKEVLKFIMDKLNDVDFNKLIELAVTRSNEQNDSDSNPSQ